MISLILPLVVAGAAPDSISLKPLTSGAMPKVGFYVPQRLDLSTTMPANFTHLPAGATRFGTLKFGGKAYPAVETQQDGEPYGIEVDFSGTGDFGSAHVIPWTVRKPNPGSAGSNLYMATIQAPTPICGGANADLSFYRFEPNDPQRAQLKDTLLYYGNYALEGTANLGGKSYNVMLVDTMSKGEFGQKLDKPMGKLSAYTLLIDRDGDGKFKMQYEGYDPEKPFNIGGTTYELTGLTGAGSHIGVRKSSVEVAEVPIPQVFAMGKPVAPFTATDRSGHIVHFPQDFKGKVVMLDFWATWCGPCMGEVPNVVKVYNQLHSQGFEILGISLDNAETMSKIDPVTKEHGMTWNQIADGKYWDAAIAKLYNVQAIPQAYIIDGDTGMILAEGQAVRGDALLPAVQKALASKQGAQRK
jgi:thiol-disulfide isomerase/thioredoxin